MAILTFLALSLYQCICFAGPNINNLSLEFTSPPSTNWSFSGTWDVTNHQGWLTWTPSGTNQFTEAQVLPATGINLATYPPPWEIRTRILLPSTNSTYAIGFWGNQNSNDIINNSQWLQIFVSWNGSTAKITKNGGVGADENPMDLPTNVMNGNPIDLILQCLASTPTSTSWRLLAKPNGSSQSWSYEDFTGPPGNTLGPFGMAIEERQPFYNFIGGVAPTSPRTYQLQYIEFSQVITPPDGQPYAAKFQPFDLQARARLGKRALLNIADPARGYPDPPPITGLKYAGLPYFITQFNQKPASMYHAGADYAVTLGNDVDGALLAGIMTGDTNYQSQLSNDIGMLMAYVTNGFAMSNYPLYCPNADPGGESSALMALLTLYKLGDQEALTKALEMASAHWAIAVKSGPYAYWPGQWCTQDNQWNAGYGSSPLEEPNEEPITNGWASFDGMFIEPLAYLLEVTNYPPARKLAVALSRFVIEVSTDFNTNGLINVIPGSWNYTQHFLSRMQTVAGILKLGQVLNNAEFLTWAQQAYDTNRTVFVSSFGFNPENDYTRLRTESWGLNELITCAALLASDGQPQYWDDVERFSMNALMENQLVNDNWQVPPAQTFAANDSNGFNYTRVNVMERMLGAFAGFGRVNDFTDGDHNQNDGNGRCARSLYTVWYYATQTNRFGLQVNLWFSKRIRAADVLSYLPGSNTLQITMHQSMAVRVRRPAWAASAIAVVTVNGVATAFTNNGVWIQLPKQPAGAIITVSLPNTIRTTHETWDGQNLTIQWRGNAIINMTPTGTYQPYYEDRNTTKPCIPPNYLPTINLDPLHYGLGMLDILQQDHSLVASWHGPGTLQSAFQINGPWTDVSNAVSPWTIVALSVQRFYRLRQ